MTQDRIYTISYSHKMPIIELKPENRYIVSQALRLMFDNTFKEIDENNPADFINAEDKAKKIIETAERLHLDRIAVEMKNDLKNF